MADEKNKTEEPKGKRPDDSDAYKFYFPVWDVSIRANNKKDALAKLASDEDFVKKHPEVKAALAELEEGKK
jgi:hypothetical protein